MAIRIRKLSSWKQLVPGKVLEPLIDTSLRKMTVQFNTEQPTRIGWVTEGAAEPRDILLGIVNGLETIEFRPPGPGVITVQGEGEVWYQTDDGESTVANDGNDQESYVKLLEPKDRSQQLEEIIIRQQAAYNRRMAQQEGERAARDAKIAALEAALAEQEAARGEDTGGVVAEPPAAEADGGAGSASDAGKTGKGAKLPAAE